MHSDRSAPDLAEQLAQATAKIARLEAALASRETAAAQPPGAVLESIPDAFAVLDRQFRFTWVNPEAERLIGMKRQEVLGRSLFELFPDAVGSILDRQLQQALAEQSSQEFENFFAPRQRWYSYKAYPTNEGGLAIYWRDITRQKRLQAGLRRESPDLEQLQDCIITTDLQGNITSWNHAAAALLGYEPREVIGRNVSLLYGDKDRADLGAKLLQSLLKEGQAELHLRNRRKPGEERWIRLSLSVLREENGHPHAILGVAADFTGTDAGRSAEEALQKSEERFRLAARALEGVVFDWDLQTGVVHRTGDLAGIIGTVPSNVEGTGQWWQERIHPDDAARSAFSILQHLPSDQTSFETEFRIRHAGGHWVDVCDRGYIVRNEDGTPVRVVGTSQNITVRKQLEREVRENTAKLRFQAGILATNDAVIAIDTNQTVTYFSPGAERMYRVSSSEAVGKQLTEVYRFEWLNPEDEREAGTDLAERGSWSGSNVHITRDGTRLFVNSTVNALPAEAGGGVVAVIRDETAKRTAELESLKKSAELVRANTDLLHFAYAVSHDLQAPLRTVISFSQLLSLKYRSALDVQGGEFVQMIVDAGSRAAAMIRDLMTFAKCAGAELKFEPEVSLEAAIATALKDLRIEAHAAAAVITRDPLPLVSGDAGQLAQLFQNLIGNSIKYRKKGTAPEIHISAERGEREWVVHVRDNGIGFEPKQSERIFDVFTRLHGAEYSGTGVGLAICKRIVERRGGRIWAAGQHGEGARFVFSIPDEAGESAVALPSAPPAMEEAGVSPPDFGEVFQTLDLAQAMVRDLHGKVLVWTKGAERLFGWSKAETVGRHLHELLRTEFGSPPLHEIEAELLNRGEWKGELRKFRRDGSAVWVASHWALHRDGSGRPQSVIEVASDITALKEVAQVLHRAGAQREFALRAGQMGVWSWDRRTGVVEWDRTTERLHGLPAGAFERTFDAFLQTVHSGDLDELKARVEESLATGTGYSIEYRIASAGGSGWLRAQGQVISAESGEPAGLSGVVWDISRDKQEELDRQFLLDLGAKLMQSPPAGPVEIAVRELGEYAGVARCVFLEVEAAAGQATVLADYHPGGTSIQGSYPLDAFGAAIEAADPDGRVVEPLHARAFLPFPMMRDGVWCASLAFADSAPRTWTKRDRSLLRGVAERLWPALENARLLQLSLERHEQFERTFEQAAVGLAHVAPDGRWLRVNQRLCEITGYSREELLASRFQKITHPDDLDSDLRQYAALKRGEIQSYSIEKRYRHESGSLVWINLTVSLVQAGGAPKYAIAVIEDITARKTADDSLRDANQLSALRLREIEALYAQAPVGLLFLDRDLRFVRINDYLAGIGGISARQCVGRTVAEVFPELASSLGPVLRGAMESRSPIIEKEVRGCAPATPGLERVWLVNLFPFEAPDGSILGLNGVIQEITERKQMEAARAEANERLRIATSAAQLGIFEWDVRQDRAFWENDRMYQITGRTREQGPANMAAFITGMVHPADRERFSKDSIGRLKPGELFVRQCRICREDGTIRHVEVAGRCELGADGAPSRVMGVMVDITDRVEMESASRDRRQLLLKVLDSLYAFVGVMSPDGVLLDANRAPLEASGMTAEEVVGKLLPDTFWWSYSPEVQGRIWEAIREAQTGKSSRFDIAARMKEGRLLTLDFMISPLRGDNGEILYLIPSAVPIEGRKRIEEGLRKSEERYLLAEWATNDGLWDWEPESDYCYFSPRFKALLGLNDDEMENRGTAVFERVHPDDLPALTAAVRLHFEEQRAYDVEARARLKDGSYRWFRTRGQALRDENGKVLRMIGSMSDIHDRKQADALARELDEQLNRQFREIAEALPEMIWVADPQGTITYANPHWYAFSGVAYGRTLGDRWASLVHPDDLSKLGEGWHRSVQTGKHYESESRLRRHDGVYHWFLHRAEPLRDEHGTIVKWLGTSTDIHEQKLTEQALRRSNEDLEQFAYAASHDLQEPLRTVSIYSQLVCRKYGKQESEAEMFARYIANSVRQMDSLLKGILEYSRAGAATEPPTVTYGETAFRMAIANLESTIAESGASITHGELPKVLFPETALVQLFQNLLSNAVKYHGEAAPRIRVTAARDGRWQRFSVEDNGIGIRQDYLERIFGVFKRLHKDEYPGVGIGLAICKRIVERQGGRIWAESVFGQGTVFHFTLPAVEGRS